MKSALDARLNALHFARIKADQPAFTGPMLVSTTSTDMMVSSTALAPTNTTSSDGMCQDFRLETSSTSLAVGSSTALVVTAGFNGVREDVTSETNFVWPGTVVWRAGRVIALKPGTGVIKANYQCEGRLVQAQLPISVIIPTPVVPIGITVSVTPNSIKILGTATVVVTEIFSDGSKTNVSSLAKLSLTNPNVGLLKGPIFTAYQLSGTTNAEASFTDGTSTWTGSAGLTIVNPDIPTP
jgi:hypothetical protein